VLADRKNFRFVEVRNELNVNNTIACLAKVAKVPVLIVVSGPHDDTRQTFLANDLGHIVVDLPMFSPDRPHWSQVCAGNS